MGNQNSVTFVSPTNELRLVKTPTRRKPIGEGGDFINVPGESVTFREGQLVVSSPELLSWLRDHVEYGRLFHEQGAEPDRPREDTSAIHGLIVELALDGKTDQIADILVAERSSYSRPDVIAACEKALNKAGEQAPPLPQVPEHELERVRMPPAAAPPVESLQPGPPSPEGNPTAEIAPPPAPAPQAGAELPEPPPQVGKGSGAKDWAAYCRKNGIAYPEGAKKAELVKLVKKARSAK